jgi:hypothetical protein
MPGEVRVVIVYPDGSRTPLDDDDLLETGRMIMGEGGAESPDEAAAIIWTLIQRKWWGTGMPTPNPSRFGGLTWTSHIRAFSQPINPIWRDPNSASCRDHPTQCSAETIAHRQRMAALTWQDMTPVVINAVQLLADGQLPNNVPGVVDFRAKDAAARGIIAADARRDASDIAGSLANAYFYSRQGTSKAWAARGIAFTGGLDLTTGILASLFPGGRAFISGALRT